MNTDKYYYHIEVNMHPLPEDSPHEPYFWVIWEFDKSREESKTNAGFGWASTPEKAWDQARRYYRRAMGESLTKVNGIKECWQPEWTTESGNTVVGDCYESKIEAQHHAAVVDLVRVGEDTEDVAGIAVRKRRYIPSGK